MVIPMASFFLQNVAYERGLLRERSAAGPSVGAQPQQPVADQCATTDGKGPEGQALGDDPPLLEGQHTPNQQPQGGNGAEEMPLQ